MAANIEELNLDEITEEFLRDECEEMGLALGVDTRQGSVYMDSSSGHILRTAKFFNDLRQIRDIISIWSCTGEVLDEKLTERGMQRNPPEATAATYRVTFSGAVPDDGSRMMCDGYFFTLHIQDGEYFLESEEVGSHLNDLQPGLPVIPQIDVDNLISATLGELVTAALDPEDDDTARERLIRKISGPAENGNKAQVKAWCEEVEGVGLARIVPLWDGPNTVQGIIIAADGVVPTTQLIEDVQEHLDPGGEGMGEGVATIGQIFTATAAVAVPITISVDIEKGSGASYTVIKDRLTEGLRQYFADLALNSEGSTTIRYTTVGARLSQIEGVIDYDNLTINGDTRNIVCTIYQVPVLEEVTIGEGIL